MHRKLGTGWQTVLHQVESLQSDYNYIKGLSKPRIALFGAGAVGLDALQYFQKSNYTIDCFVDNSISKHGTKVNGIPVVSFDHHLVSSASIVIITTKTGAYEIRNQLNKLRLRHMSFDTYFVLDNLNRFIWVRNEILTDNVSVVSLDGILLSMLTNSPKYCAEIMEPNQYFCLPHFLNTDDYFVDAGGYVGDTVEKFIWANTGMFQHIYIFEPGTIQLSALRCRMNRLITEWAIDPHSISIINAGLSDQNGNAHFGTTSLKLAATAINHNAQFTLSDRRYIPLWSLDSYIEQHPSSITFLKSDIEGMEVSMLKGAANTIRRYKPKLALSTYHKPGDLFEIIDIVKSYVPEYQMSLRHHSSNLSETVLYCWIDSDDMPHSSKVMKDRVL